MSGYVTINNIPLPTAIVAALDHDLATTPIDKLTLSPLNIPFSAVLAWPKPNYINSTQQAWLVPLAIALQVLVGIILGLRLWARWTRRAGVLGVDDILVTVGAVFGAAMSGLVCNGKLPGVLTMTM